MVVKATDFTLIAGQQYKMGADEILCRCVFYHKQHWIISEPHISVVGGHYSRKETTCKILQATLWWPTIHMDNKRFCQSYDFCQRTGKPSRHNEIPLVPQITLQAFDKWAIDFVGPINPLGKWTGACYIITSMDYLTRWPESAPIKDCFDATATKFLFENVVTRFSYPKILVSDEGTHFVNKLIYELTTKFHIQHKKITPYYPQENGTMEAFNFFFGKCINQSMQHAQR